MTSSYRRVYADTVFAGVFLFLHSVFVLFQACNNFPVVDEHAHLAAGVANLKNRDFAFYRVNPPLSRMVAAVPVFLLGSSDTYLNYDYSTATRALRPEFNAGFRILEEHGTVIQKEFVGPRLFCLVFTLVGGVVLFGWTKEIFGRMASRIALVLWCASPNIVANAAIVGPDLAATSCGVVACYFFWKWSRARNYRTAVIAGAFLGIAMLSKSTWMLGMPVFVSLFAFACVRFNGDYQRSISVQILLFCAAAFYVVNAGYLFTGTLPRLDSLEFRSSVLKGEAYGRIETGNRFEGTIVGALPLPLPKDYVLGVDYLKWEVEGKMVSFLAGEQRHGSWWYYYVVAVILKTPLGTLLLMVLGVCGIASVRDGWALACLAIPLLAVFVVVSATGGFNHHHRYILPIYPLIFVLAGGAFGGMHSRGVFMKYFGWGALLFSLLASASSFLFPHTFFNAIAGGPYHGYRWLTSSNVEWGQDLLKVDSWVSSQEKDSLIAIRHSYPGTPEKLFRGRVFSESRLAVLLKDGTIRGRVVDDGVVLIFHSTWLSENPESISSILVKGRIPDDWIAASYMVFVFRGTEGLEQLDSAYLQ